MQRLCTKSYKYDDISISKGMLILIPTMLIHKDPRYWEDPDQFDPLR